MNLIALLAVLIVLGLVFWAVRAIAVAFQIPAPIVTVINVVLVIICVLYLLQAFGLWAGGPIIRVN